MGALFWSGLIAVAIGWVVYKIRQREKMLAEMTPEQRKAFLATEARNAEIQKKARENAERETVIAEPRLRVNLARNEGRVSIRLGIPIGHMAEVSAWATSQGLKSMRIRDGERNEVQISISGITKGTIIS